MIGIVIVSHSRQISDGLKRMADAMGQESIPVVSAGGMDEPDDPLGTDALRILQAIQEVLHADGVLVFADIGAAKLNAETAIDLLEDAQKRKVRLCDAPLVEGVLAAAVQSAAGGSIEDVMREAQTAYTPPMATGRETERTPSVTPSADALLREYEIATPLGLHARPAALFVSAMNRHQSAIDIRNVTKNSGYVNAKSINKVMTLEVQQRDRIGVSASGPDAAQVHDAIQALIDQNFGEAPATGGPPSAPPPKPATDTADGDGSILNGTAIRIGYAVAPARFLRIELPDVDARQVDDVDAEVVRFDEALATARAEIEALIQRGKTMLDDYEVRIFEAHLLHLDDPEIAEAVRKRIRKDKSNAEHAWRDTVAAMVASYRGLADPVIQARGDDLADVGLRVLRILTGADAMPTRFETPVILCTKTLRPSDIPTLDFSNVQGLCTEKGSKTSHAGILASGLNVPVVFGLGARIEEIEEGRDILLDGASGTVDIDPDAKAIKAAQEKRTAWRDRMDRAERIKFRPATTRDGQRRRVAANMQGLQELGNIVASGAEEVGLFRTEFLYMNRTDAPGEDEQYGIYRAAVAGLDGRPLVIRTMDIGGDKPVPYLQQPNEANPNLGWRGLRFCLANTKVFHTQLRAILRASSHGPVRVMFPMVSTVDEVTAARREVEAAEAQLTGAGLDFDPTIQIGIMVEVPAAAETADALAAHVDFFSIGTNDLTQYVMAADRGNPKVADLIDPFHPAVLRVIQRTIHAAKRAKIWVGMCGAMAGDPMAAPILLGLGLDEFSMNAAQVPEFKLSFSHLSADACARFAEEALALDTAAQVRERTAAFLDAQTE